MSSLLNPERGATHLLSSSGRVEWRFPDSTEYRESPWCSEPVCLFPASGRHDIPAATDQELPHQAVYASGFLRSRHAGIDIPSRILARAIIDDAQERIRQEIRGDTTVGRTLAVYQTRVDEKQVLLLLCVGGLTRSDLCALLLTVASELVDGVFTAAVRPVFQTLAPIMQVCVSGELVLVRSVGSTFVGKIRHTRTGYVFDECSSIHTSYHRKPMHVDALLGGKGVAAIDSRGTLRLYDAHGKRCGNANRNAKLALGGERDPGWHLAWTGEAMLAASSSSVFSVDSRGEHACIVKPGYSPVSLGSSVNTALASLGDNEFALATTDYVLRYDIRSTAYPLHVWPHWRGFDRSLALTPYEHDRSVLLSSQDNRLLTLYEMSQGEHARRIAPCVLPSAAPPGRSPTPPHVHHEEGRALLLEQTMVGAVWARWIGSEAPIDVQWPPGAVRNSRRAHETQDPGPFGRSEKHIYDMRTAYRAAFLGWLGLSGPDTQTGNALPLIRAIRSASATDVSLCDISKSCLPTPAPIIHWNSTLGAALLHGELLDRFNDALMEYLGKHTNKVCLGSVRWNSSSDVSESLLAELASRRTFDPTHEHAARQEALDVMLACTHAGRGTREPRKQRHGNWRWDQQKAPALPEVSLGSMLPVEASSLSDGRAVELSDAAKLLLFEWPEGTDVHDYEYINPYQGLDLAMPAAPSSQPQVRSRRAVPQVSSQREVPSISSQHDTQYQSSQEEPFRGVQSQAVPGRFGQRAPAPQAKRRKRMGGF
ncbi:hypothetical protein MCUN1_001880 [Malassezia cuniculi]|uniref:RRN6 K-rich C-terminal domain-containing protein n=1 Tax=Malassezia cuniculi TaxID=948313 RepID=A0AAF0ETW2_9BASI|nr:hypothetical protein MCUN1_001880 [Malassezia cuniculi]